MTDLLEGRRILLAVGGGISAYKAPELVRRLQDAGADVQVMLTTAGGRFVSQLSLEVVSGQPVGTNLWTTDPSSRIVHTDIGDAVDLIVIAPATANLVGRIAHGLADDLVTTSIMASGTPVLVVPAMNTDMLDNPLVAANLRTLDALERYTVLTPDVGLLACGVTGRGRQPDPPVIIEAAASVLTPKTLPPLRAVVSAGPTWEALDPVRFITNRSTGTMGFQLARALAAAGARVTLVSGPVSADTPVGIERRVEALDAAAMASAIDMLWDELDLLIMTAAVADYRPAQPSANKIKKGAGPLSLTLERTEDILASTAARAGRADRVVVGFAAETDNVEASAQSKLDRKALDWIVANDVSRPGVGFGPHTNEGIILGAGGERIVVGKRSKARFAEAITAALTPELTRRFGLAGADGGRRG